MIQLEKISGLLMFCFLISGFFDDTSYYVRVRRVQGGVATLTTLDSNLEMNVRFPNFNELDYLSLQLHPENELDISFSCLPYSELGCDGAPYSVRIAGEPVNIISWRLCGNMYDDELLYQEASLPSKARIVEGPSDGNMYGYLIQARCGRKYIALLARAFSDSDRLRLSLRRGDSVEVSLPRLEPRIAIVNGRRMSILGVLFTDKPRISFQRPSSN